MTADDETHQIKDPAEEHQVGLSDDFIREVGELLDQGYTDRIQELCRDLSPPDAAELLGKLEETRRHNLVSVLEDILSPEAFSYLDVVVLNDLFAYMPSMQIAGIINALDSDDAIRLVDELGDSRRNEIMRHLSRKVRAAVEEGLTFPERSAGRLMQREFVAIPQFWTVGKTVDYLRAAADALPQKFYDIFIVDPMHRFIGSAPLSRILCAQRSVKVDTLVSDEHVTIPATLDRSEVAHIFRRKDLLSAPVIGKDDLLIGAITVDDVVDVIDEEASEDILKLGGVTDTDLNRSTLATAKSRSWWLAVNLLTAILASIVIGFFEGAIAKIVALAVLMPIVASMGGNAGTQTLTVVIRALATKELSSANTWRIVAKEFMVGCINGLVFALLMGGLVSWWYKDAVLGFVIALAMVINLMAAGLSGILIPVALDRAGLDPAPSAGVFLTTVTDVVGFFAFLSLAVLFLL